MWCWFTKGLVGAVIRILDSGNFSSLKAVNTIAIGVLPSPVGRTQSMFFVAAEATADSWYFLDSIVSDFIRGWETNINYLNFIVFSVEGLEKSIVAVSFGSGSSVKTIVGKFLRASLIPL